AMMAPAMIAPPTMPPMTAPGPQPRRCALASVAVAASVPAMIAAAVSAVSVFFMPISLRTVGSADQEFNCPASKHCPEGNLAHPPSHLHYENNYFVGILVMHKGEAVP